MYTFLPLLLQLHVYLKSFFFRRFCFLCYPSIRKLVSMSILSSFSEIQLQEIFICERIYCFYVYISIFRIWDRVKRKSTVFFARVRERTINKSTFLLSCLVLRGLWKNEVPLISGIKFSISHDTLCYHQIRVSGKFLKIHIILPQTMKFQPSSFDM